MSPSQIIQAVALVSHHIKAAAAPPKFVEVPKTPEELAEEKRLMQTSDMINLPPVAQKPKVEEPKS